MRSKLKSDKEKICTALDVAYQKVLDEQNVYRARIDAIMELSDDEVQAKLLELGEVGIAEIMKSERYPACLQDRQKHLEQPWDEIPSQIRINHIEDKDIRFQTYFLNEVAEHRDRIKAVTVFCEAIRPNKNNVIANLIFNFWKDQFIFTQLAQEQKSVDEEKSALMKDNALKIKGYIEILTSSYVNDGVS